MEAAVADLDLHERIQNAPKQLLAARIRRARKESSLSHDKFGEKAGVGRHHLIKLENGKHRPKPDMLRRIAEAAGRSVDWFVDPEVDPSPFPDEADGDGRRAA